MKKKMNESKFISMLRQQLKEKGWLTFKINERFASGFPDLIAIRSGEVRFIECKVDNNQLTKLQVENMYQILQKNGKCFVATYSNKDESYEFIAFAKYIDRNAKEDYHA